MQQSQSIRIPQQLSKHKDFPLRISQCNQKVYNHIEYLKYLVESMYQLYRKMSKSLIKLTQQHQKKMTKLNDSTALSILNFIKGIQKLFQNIRQQISNNTVNLNKKNQKVSRTRKDIIYEKLTKINELFGVYLQKVQKYNTKQQQYETKCEYFNKIDEDILKFYSTKENKNKYEELMKKQCSIQEQLEQTYSLKIQLKSGLCELRLSLKEFFQMLSNNADDDKKLLLSVRKKLKETKLFNETIIQEVNSQAEESVQGYNQYRTQYHRKQTMEQTQKQYVTPITLEQDQMHCTFSTLNPNISISEDVNEITKNIHLEEFCIETFCSFISQFQKQIMQNGQNIDKMRNTQDFQKFIDKKFQINELLTSDMVYNTQAIKNEIADIRQVIQSIKALLDKKKVINQLKKYRSIKYQKFIQQTQPLIQLQRKSNQSHQVRLKYKQQRQKFAKGHFQLMRRFRQMVQEMFRDISQNFKFQRNPDQDFRKTKNEFIKQKYYSLLMLAFFVNKEEPPKFQMNVHLKNYEKNLSQEHLKKIGLGSAQSAQNEKNTKSKWACFNFISNQKSQKNKYIDEYNCALTNGILLIQGKMKIHQNYLKFVSSFNAKTFFGETNIRVPKWDIESIDKKYVLLSLVVVIKTIRGSFSFTSFLCDPYEKLLEIYEHKQPTKKILPRQQSTQQKYDQTTPGEQKVTEKTNNETVNITTNCKSPKNGANYIVELQQRFQSQIPQLIDKSLINFESLSTYLSESKKQLSVSVQYNLAKNKEKRYFFEIKIFDRNSKVEYKFIHEKSMEDEKIKKMLEKMAVSIVNCKSPPNSPKRFQITRMNSMSDAQTQRNLFRDQEEPLVSNNPKHENDKIFEQSYSFIERKQNNQFQFDNDNDPSFVYFKQNSVAHHGGDPSFNYIPDLQILKNMNSERKLSNGQIKNTSRHSQKSSSSKGSRRSFSKEQIDDYLNSIDEKDLKKNVYGDKMNNKNLSKYSNGSVPSTRASQKSQSGFALNQMLLLLIVIVLLNVIISIFK